MKAMILAAGYGTRMQKAYPNIPKPLIPVGNTTLIEHNLSQLRDAGFTDVVINVSYLADQIINKLGDGKKYQLNIQYSIEKNEPLETGGGIKKALPLLGSDPFLMISSDIWTDYPFERLFKKHVDYAHLVLVNNTADHPQGDFALCNNLISLNDSNQLTFGSIAVLNPQLFDTFYEDTFRLAAALKKAIQNNHPITGEHYLGNWHNVGTPEALKKVKYIA